MEEKTLLRILVRRSLDSSLLFRNLLPKNIEPENVAELSDEVLSRLGLATISDHHCLRVLCANVEKQHQSATVAAAALSECMAVFSR